jgi:hypothetical protein
MNSMKMALLAGAAIAVTSAGAQADDLEALKAQIDSLNTRIAAMETAPSVPTGYQLIAVSKGELQQTPGLDMSVREQANYGNRSTIISVLPTADAPAGTTISWSGFARAGLVHSSTDYDFEYSTRVNDGAWDSEDSAESDDNNDLDVYARGQLRVVASTDTAVGEVGVDMRIRGTFDGIDSEGDDFKMDVAWGYWALTPEMTLGGGYTGSLGEVGYSFDASCRCNYIDTVGFNPGATSQMRLSYASGPLSMGIALEDASVYDGGILEDQSGDQLGVAGEIKYSGDTFGAEIAGSWRGLEDDSDASDVAEEFLADSWWQIGAGVGFALGDMLNFNIAAAVGEGPTVSISDDGAPGDDEFTNPWNNQWYGVSGLVSANLSDEVHAELGAGFISRDFDSVNADDGEYTGESERWVVGGGLYYAPVDQLTLGVEGSYKETTAEAQFDEAGADPTFDEKVEGTETTTTVDFVAVWSF